MLEGGFPFLSVPAFLLCVFAHVSGSSSMILEALSIFFSLPLNFCCIFPAMPSCNQEIEEVGPALSVCPSISVFTCPTACFTPLSCFSLLFSSHIYQYSFVAYCHVTLFFCFAVMARHMNQTVNLKSFLTAIRF